MKGLLFITLSLASAFASAQSVPWKITQPQWNENHEKSFGEFVASIGDAVEKRKCNRVDSCLKSAANPYVKSDPAGLAYYADCADLPYYLRGYFAWKNQLPFSMASKMEPNPLEDGNPSERDVRYSPRGNKIVERYNVLTKSSLFNTSVPDALNVLNNKIPGYTFSANYRITGNVDSNDLFTDFYPVKLSRQGVRPGTVIYDPNGHVAIVYKVTEDGHVFYIDAHPDNTLTMGLYTPKFVRSHPTQGAGFKRFRPLALIDAKRESNGLYTGGYIQAMPNKQLKDYSTEQFFGTTPDPSGNWSKGKFTIKNQVVTYYDYVRMSLTLGEQHIDPLNDMAQIVADICVTLQDRVPAVDGARLAGIDKKPHPVKLPYNIYGTDGEWENFSTPSRDARLKVSFMDLLDQTKRNIAAWKRHDPTIKYDGGNLAQDLYNVYADKAKNCQFSYTTSSGKSVLMNLEAGRQRLFAMSFDPYTCIERRWGARLPEELSGCGDDANKTAWYNQEQWLRNQWERRYDARMDYTLPELTGPLPGAGIANPPDVDIVTYLRSEM
jgi:hypothetical protein